MIGCCPSAHAYIQQYSWQKVHLHNPTIIPFTPRRRYNRPFRRPSLQKSPLFYENQLVQMGRLPLFVAFLRAFADVEHLCCWLLQTMCRRRTQRYFWRGECRKWGGQGTTTHLVEPRSFSDLGDDFFKEELHRDKEITEASQDTIGRLKFQKIQRMHVSQ